MKKKILFKIKVVKMTTLGVLVLKIGSLIGQESCTHIQSHG